MHPGITNPTPRKSTRLLVIDTRSPYVGKISPPYYAPKCDRPAHYEWQGKLFDVHGREIVPGQPLPPDATDPNAGVIEEMASHDDEVVPATHVLAQIRDTPMARLRELAGRLIGEENLHRTRHQIAHQLRELTTRDAAGTWRDPSDTRHARARAARAERAEAMRAALPDEETVEILDHPDA